MKILVLSDTHGYMENARDVLEKIGDRMEAVFHLGDHDEDAEQLQMEFPYLNFYYVKGNNDYSAQTPSKLMVTLQGKRFLLTHGHKQRVYWGYDQISYWGEEQGADAVIFGHTHAPVNEEMGALLLFNPGSISLPRDSSIPTFGILHLSEEGVLRGSVMEYLSRNTLRLRV